MKQKSNPRTAFFILAGFLAAGYSIYMRRPLNRIPSQEGLEDPEVTRAFDAISRLPQMSVIRRYAIKRAIQLVDHGLAVDLGCGPGYLVFELANLASNLHVTGIDISSEMLARAEEIAVNSPVADRVDFKLGNASAIPFPDQSLDLVISTFSLHHWDDPVRILNEISRVLRPGGAYMIFDLRRDMVPPAYVLLWFATNFVVPRALHRINEPLGSRNAAYTPQEAGALTSQSLLGCANITKGPLWLTIEGRKEE